MRNVNPLSSFRIPRVRVKPMERSIGNRVATASISESTSNALAREAGKTNATTRKMKALITPKNKYNDHEFIAQASPADLPGWISARTIVAVLVADVCSGAMCDRERRLRRGREAVGAPHTSDFHVHRQPHLTSG